jgi:hypothetical protein
MLESYSWVISFFVANGEVASKIFPPNFTRIQKYIRIQMHFSLGRFQETKTQQKSNQKTLTDKELNNSQQR